MDNDDLKPGIAYECFITLSKGGKLRILAKEQDRPRLYDVTERIHKQFDEPDIS